MTLLIASATASAIHGPWSSSKPQTAANSDTVVRTTESRRGSLAILSSNLSGPLAAAVTNSGSLPSQLIATSLTSLDQYHTHFSRNGSGGALGVRKSNQV